MRLNPKRLIVKISDLEQESQKYQKDVHWLLIHVGLLKPNFDSVYFERELFFIKIDSDEYPSPEKWNNEEVVSVFVREERLLNYPLGTIFNKRGELAKYAYKTDFFDKKNQLYSNHIQLINGKSLIENRTKIKDFYKNTDFEKVLINIPNAINSLYVFTRKEKTYLVPNYVIGKYFYYYSSTLINCFLHNKLDQAIIKKEKIKNRGYVFYDKQVIRKSDISMIGRYLFSNGNENAFTGLSRIYKQLHIELYNEGVNESKMKKDVVYRIPFEVKINARVVGQYISKDVFYVYDIINVEPESDDEKLWDVDHIKYIDVKNYVLGNNAGSQSLNSGVKILPNQKQNGYKSDISDSDPRNSSVPLEDKPIENGNFFFDKPYSKKFTLRDNGKVFNRERLVGIELDGYTFNVEEYSGVSNSQGINIFMDGALSPYKIFQEAIEMLTNDGCKTEYIILGDGKSPFSYFSGNIFEGVHVPFEGEFLVAEVERNSEVFYFIDTGPGRRIGIFKYTDADFECRRKDLLSFFKYMLRHGLNWSYCYADGASQEYRDCYDIDSLIAKQKTLKSELSKNKRTDEGKIIYKNATDKLTAMKRFKYSSAIEDEFPYEVLQPLDHVSGADPKHLFLRMKQKIEQNIDD